MFRRREKAEEASPAGTSRALKRRGIHRGTWNLWSYRASAGSIHATQTLLFPSGSCPRPARSSWDLEEVISFGLWQMDADALARVTNLF